MRFLIVGFVALLAVTDASAFGGRCRGCNGGATTCGRGLFGAFRGPIATRIQEHRAAKMESRPSAATAAPCNCGPGCICQPAGQCGGANCQGYQCGPVGQPNVPATNPGAYWVAPWCDGKGHCYPGSWVNPPVEMPKAAPKPMPKGLDFPEEAPMPQLREETKILAENPDFVDFDF